VRFAFIDAEKAYFPIAALCRLLEVTRQGYYAFRKPTKRPRQLDELRLQQRIRALHEGSAQRYGSPRVLRALRREGVHVSKRRVERAMRGMGLVARAHRRFRVTTKSDERHLKLPNVLARDFTAAAPNQRWVTDITYVWTAEGWAYVSVILDLFSRAVVGWAIDASLATRLPLRALEMAVQRRRPGSGLLHHSDRGCQYTGIEYRDELKRLGVVVSMSRKGNCWDNAVAESFFSTMKTELTHRQTWSSRLELRNALFEYLEVFYNRERLHSTLGYRTPAEVERDFCLNQAA
jgi:putative transposase